MKKFLLIPALLACALLSAREQEEGGRRIQAGPSFLEPLQPRDSVLVWDQFHYGIELKDIPEGTPIALPVLNEETRRKTAEGQLAILGDWQLDSVKVSSPRDSVTRYNIRAYMTIAPAIPGQFELFELECLVDRDTLVFIHQMLDVKEPSIDLETFQPNGIRPQERFPYTFKEIAPWVAAAIGIIVLLYNLILLLYLRRKKAIEAEKAEPAHIRALRKLDKYRGDIFWKPEHQKAFYSGVTDTLREYIAARYGVGALEMTTAEIFDGLKKTDVPADLYEEMKDLFERADFVKFAKYTASDEDNAKVLPGAVRFVTGTYQSELERDSSTSLGMTGSEGMTKDE